MRPRLFRTLSRLALLAAAVAATIPTHAADGTLGQARVPVEVGAEIWRLRPSQAAAASPPARTAPATEIPAARRSVRMVYPALVEAR